MPAMLRELEAFAQTTRTEKGCIEYLPLLSREDEDLIVILERWEDEDALRAHLDTTQMAAYREATRPFVEERSATVFERRSRPRV